MAGFDAPDTAAWRAFGDWAGAIRDLSGTATLLGWDRETLMPGPGAAGRAKLLGTLAALGHRELTRPDARRLLEDARTDAQTADQVRAVDLMEREHDRAAKVPEELVREISEAASHCVSTWITARRTGDFPAFADALTPLVRLKRRYAEALEIGDEPYDGLLDRFEPGARAAELERLFAELAGGLRDLLSRVDRGGPAMAERSWAPDAQMALARELARSVGFAADEVVVAESAHPFSCSPHHGDVRFTTRVDGSEPISNILAVMHEAGHALYEAGFPEAFARTPLRDAPSLGAHESQSRFWENHVGRTAAFWQHLEPVLRRLLPEAMEGLDAEMLHREATRVEPSLIRVEADEVTYNLHVVLRFEIELALIRGDLEVSDLPVVWNEGMERLLGIRPDSDANGCMQDIHWPEGMFGYFPTYTLGNLYAAQLDAALGETIGSTQDLIAKGDFAPLLGFMRERVHAHGNLMDAAALMKAATGQELSSGPFLAHLERAYAG